MKILMVHNTHLVPGGEDRSFSQESRLLEEKGHHVIPYVRSNEDIQDLPLWKVGLRTLWSHQDYQAVRQIIRDHQPDILHVQNTFPLISPSIFYAARKECVPSIMSLRNYRLYCLNAYFFRSNQVCERCINQPIPISGIYHNCYRDSLAGSLATASMVSLHRLLRTYQQQVDVFIALTKFARDKFASHGIPSHKLRIKPNFVYPDPNVGVRQDCSVLYVGRLSPEKGIDTLLRAWEQIGNRIQLKIAGSGPLSAQVQAAANKNSSIKYLGQQPIEQIYQLLGQAQALIFPSMWYEGMPRTIIEAFARGTPVISSRLGAMETMITQKRTGLHFEAGNPKDLVSKIIWMLDHPKEWQTMRHESRQEFENHYTAEHNYQQLMSIYEQAKFTFRV